MSKSEDELTVDVETKGTEGRTKTGISKYKKDKTLDRAKWTRFLDRHYQNYPKGGKVKYRKYELFKLIDWSVETLETEGSLLELKPPLHIVGDVHGQFDDLCRIFQTCLTPPRSRYLFLGDYVDRGPRGLECITLLLTYKVLYPDKVYLLRGNHECTRINQNYGFLQEIIQRFKDKRVWQHFQKAFDHLPAAALISEKILCMHGGLSKELNAVQDIKNIPKPIHDPRKGLINDLLWSDPEVGLKGWEASPRKTSFVFGMDVLDEYCQRLKVELIIRAHQVCQEGYRFFGNRKLVTIFSAPGYCSDSGQPNKATILKLDSGLCCHFISFIPPAPLNRVTAKSSHSSSSKK